ncbi:hypothetical protein K438DRAFT_1977452 [Mycena galopus ATCC 62051]|nr:hypothetical protein K438DRAFT_1977452 [Mycena galopus ATCC 62051]
MTTVAGPVSPSHARYHELDMNAPRLVARIKELKRHLDPVANQQKLLKLENDLSCQGPFSTRKKALADAIDRLKRQIASESSRRQLESMLVELESQQSRESIELASFSGTLALGRAQTLLPEILSEIFLQCQVPSSQNFNWGPLDVEMQATLNILRVCSSWRAAALNTPTLWCELHYADTGTLPLQFYRSWLRRAASVPLHLLIWPYLGCGEDSYWIGAVELLHTHCHAIGTLNLRLPVEDSGSRIPALFPPPHQLTNLRNLTIHSYDDCIHDTLSNIPWSQLSRLQFLVGYDTRCISPSQLAGILSQTVHLTHLVVNLGPDTRFGPSPTRELRLPSLHTLEISWIDRERQFDGIVPHSFIDAFDKLSVPELKSLMVTTSKDANTFVLPALTNLTARWRFPLESLHITMFEASSAALPVDTLVGLLRGFPTLTSFHWNTDGGNLPGLVESLTCSVGDDALLPNLIDISLELNSYDGLLPAFADMVTSRRLSNSQSLVIASLQRFHLKAAVAYVQDFEQNEEELSSVSKTSNEEALRRLEESTVANSDTSLHGSLDFRHSDQKLALNERETSVEQMLEMPQVDGDNFLYYDDDLVWNWMDGPTLYNLTRQQGLYY